MSNKSERFWRRRSSKCCGDYSLDCIRNWKDFKRECPLCNFRFQFLVLQNQSLLLSVKLPAMKEGKRITLHAEFGFVDRQRYLMVYC